MMIINNMELFNLSQKQREISLIILMDNGRLYRIGRHAHWLAGKELKLCNEFASHPKGQAKTVKVKQ